MQSLFANHDHSAEATIDQVSVTQPTGAKITPFVLDRSYFGETEEEVARALAIIDSASVRESGFVIVPARDLMYKGLDVRALAQRIDQGGVISMRDVQSYVYAGSVDWLNELLASDLDSSMLDTGLEYAA